MLTCQIIPSADDADPLESCRRVVRETGLDHVDCFLIHTPSAGPVVRRRYWEALEALRAEGLTRSIGTANYGAKHLAELREYAKVQPTINQIELHPCVLRRHRSADPRRWMPQTDIVEYCQAHDIAIEA